MQDQTQRIVERLRASGLLTCFFAEGGSNTEPLPPELRSDKKQVRRQVGRKTYEVEE